MFASPLLFTSIEKKYYNNSNNNNKNINISIEKNGKHRKIFLDQCDKCGGNSIPA